MIWVDTGSETASHRSHVRIERAGGEMPCHDNLGSIPNQSSRLDAGFGIHIKPINSTMGWIPGEGL